MRCIEGASGVLVCGELKIAGGLLDVDPPE